VVFLSRPNRFRDNASIRQLTLPSKSLPIHCSSVTLPIDAIRSEILQWSELSSVTHGRYEFIILKGDIFKYSEW
jgi:hypothetical protein